MVRLLTGVVVAVAAVALVLTSVLAGDANPSRDLLVDSPPVGAQGPVLAPAAAAVGDDRPQPAEDWVQTRAVAAGVPVPAVRAYARAAMTVQQEAPACRLGWTTLAGIGSTESDHGRIGGRVLGDDGRSSPTIVGPVLDGTGGNAAIPTDEAGTAHHGNPRWDHAVGPLQFISDTWARWGADGDGDGLADPNDLDDAALAAGRYLCHAGLDMSSAAGWGDAVFSYNHSEEYVATVLARANAVARAVG